MKMPTTCCMIHKIEFWQRADGLHQAYVFADFGGAGLDWPDTIEDGKGGKTFRFVSNEAMPAAAASENGYVSAEDQRRAMHDALIAKIDAEIKRLELRAAELRAEALK